MSRTQQARARRNRRRRRIVAGFALTLLIAVVIAVVFLGSKLWHNFGSTNDYAGDGKNDVLVEVHDGDSTTAIAQTLHDQEVIANVKTFLEAAQSNSAISSIQPGFYQLRTEIPAATAVTELVEPNNRVGQLVIPEGRQLDDVTDVKTNVATDGIFTLISKATCVELDGDRKCIAASDLRAAAGVKPLELLSIPEWASAPVTAMGDNHRRIEGLIAPGSWNVNPLESPQEILSTLIGASSQRYEESGLLDTAVSLSMSPYEVLIVASLVQREAKPHDFAKVARVIYNRLEEGRALQFDSTVNYPLDRQEVATRDSDRRRRTPWNTYVAEGLPATPICSPGGQALTAAERPVPGDWLYFVTVDMQGTTLFTRDYDQHLTNIELAKYNGVLDSAR